MEPFSLKNKKYTIFFSVEKAVTFSSKPFYPDCSIFSPKKWSFLWGKFSALYNQIWLSDACLFGKCSIFFKSFFPISTSVALYIIFLLAAFLLSSSQHHDAHLVLIPVLRSSSEIPTRRAFYVAQTFVTLWIPLFCFFSSQCCLIIPFSCTVSKALPPIRTAPPGLLHPPKPNCVISLMFFHRGYLLAIKLVSWMERDHSCV